MDSPSGLPITLKTFATNAEAIGYLEHEGFAFQGAPGRWLHIEESGPVYARIVPKVGTFQVRLCWHTKQS
jgi:hypothetical protein